MGLILGLSVLLYPKVWQDVMAKFAKDHLGLITLSMMQGILGLIIINMYNVWDQSMWVIVTIVGWAMLAKSVLYFLLPGSSTKDMMKWVQKNPNMLTLGGLIWTVVGALLTYNIYMV